MADQILVLNSGSSSIKFALFAATARPARGVHGSISGLGGTPTFRATDASGKPLSAHLPAGELDHARILRWLLDWLGVGPGGPARLAGAGHRVVHGGDRYAHPVRINRGVLEDLEQLTPMAALHQPHNLAAIRAVATVVPGLSQVACFDTAFHRTQSPLVQRYALPRELTAAGVRRYGFHGLSYEYIASVMPQHLGSRAEGRVVVAHLGSGASMCAMRGRRSVATTMGFTALDGLVMSTRCGAIDPGVLLYFLRERGMSADQLEDLLSQRSGLLGVSGISGDIRDLLGNPEPSAREAVEMFVYRAVRELGSLAAALGGLDALVFTGGIGEHAAVVRGMICEESRWLGLVCNEEANRRHETLISSAAAAASAYVIPTDEEVVIARHTCRLLGCGSA